MESLFGMDGMVFSRNESILSGCGRSPDPLFFLATMGNGQPRFQLIVAYPMSDRRFANTMKSSGDLLRSWGTTGMEELFSGRRSFK